MELLAEPRQQMVHLLRVHPRHMQWRTTLEISQKLDLLLMVGIQLRQEPVELLTWLARGLSQQQVI